jgi:branched-chain amino acid transport system permease protein
MHRGEKPTVDLALAIFPQVLMDGVVLGFTYALIALGYTMVYGVLEFINFAHGEIFVIGAFVGVEILLALDAAGALAALHPGFVLVAVLMAGMAVSGLVAVALERAAYRPLRGASRLAPLISAIGASFFLQDFIRLFESLWRNAFYVTYPTIDLLEKSLRLGIIAEVPVKSLLVIATALLMLCALYLFVRKTRFGTAIRAVAQDPTAAALMGIPVNRMIALTFFIGGAMGGIAGVLFGLHYSLVNPYTGFVPGLKAFTAAVLGGIGNIPGAVLGGMLLGLVEAFSASYLSILTGGTVGAEYKDVVAFLLLILILIFRPKGLLGERVRDEGV